MRRLTWALLAGAAMLGSCAPVENNRGYVPDMQAIVTVWAGMRKGRPAPIIASRATLAIVGSFSTHPNMICPISL